ncbi:MAG: glycoside hydrolase family 2 TIM barrel-domain containing protein, partial [Sedimentisphaerales bacterium]|nr:glycoside hydrolase family 2 TIM barrel-domain containing protein [Sedimentisphaerales bacterium]
MKRFFSLLLFLALCGMQSYASSHDAGLPFNGTQAISLDGRWSLSIDPNNVGRQQQWWKQPTQDARPTNVPWVIQDVFPDYHGVVWYWRNFDAPRNPHDQGRYLIRFWNVDYTADVWVNDKHIGSHEGADGVFVLDATEAVKAGQSNRLAVRVLNPKDEPIDGILLSQTAHRNKTCAYSFGSDYNHGGIEDSVELLVTPAVWIEDIFAQPDSKTGIVRIQLTVSNTLKKQAGGRLEVSVAPAAGGETVQNVSLDRKLPAGSTIIETGVTIKNAHLWDINDPYMYRVTARLSVKGKTTFDERSVRCGFRDFRVDNGYFRLNGKRFFLRCSHTGNCVPIGIHVPYDKDLLRRDLINVKMMGFNAIRFIAGGATPYQLDLCDEIGLLAYEEAYSAWLLADSNQMARRFDEATAGMIRRDRNHPSLVIWGVLNETADGPVFEHAVKTLPLVRSLDQSRLVLLSSGRFDCRLNIGSVANPGSSVWQCLLGDEREVNAPTGLKTVYPSPPGVGDAHLYPQVPHCADAINLLRTYGQG